MEIIKGLGAMGGLILLRIVPVQAHVVGNIVEFLAGNIVQTLAAISKLLVNLQGFLGHFFVGILSAAHQREVVALRDSLVAVGVEPHSQHYGFRFLLRQARHLQGR